MYRKLFGFDGPSIHPMKILLFAGQYEHRVAQIGSDPDNGQRIIRAKGDANPSSIAGLDYPIFRQNYIGKVVDITPHLDAILKANNTNSDNNTQYNNSGGGGDNNPARRWRQQRLEL